MLPDSALASAFSRSIAPVAVLALALTKAVCGITVTAPVRADFAGVGVVGVADTCAAFGGGVNTGAGAGAGADIVGLVGV
jgi:hypothetical protein